MKTHLVLLTILFSLLLVACGTKTAVTPTSTNTPPPSETETAVVEPTSLPAAESDPYQRARQLLEQAAFAAPDGWQVTACEGEAAVLCINDGQTNVGYAELLLFPLAGYSDDHALRLAADKLPTNAAAYTADDSILARQALVNVAEEHLANIANDRAITYPDDAFTSLGMEPTEMGGLPALTFGFVRTNTTGDIQERYRHVAAFDQQFIYWFGLNYDPANISTFVSDTAVAEFTPYYFQIAASLPIDAIQTEN